MTDQPEIQKDERGSAWLRRLSWILAGVYIAFMTLWSLLRPSSFQELEGLALLVGLPIGFFVVATTVRSDG